MGFNTKLPFLKEHTWPKIGKLVGTSKYGFSEDDETMEHALDELLAAVEAKDHKKMSSSLRAIVDVIRNQEHAADSQ